MKLSSLHVVRGLIVVAIVSATMLGFSAVVAAEDLATAPESTVKRDYQLEKEAYEQRLAERRDQAKERLDGARLQACEARKETITNILSRITERGQRHLNVFTKIADRVEAFYQEKDREVANYDTLAATVQTKKAAAQTAIENLNSTSTTFDCSGENPKAVVSSFKEVLRAEIQALKEYRTSIKNLIVAVKSAQGALSSDKEESR